MVHLLPSFFLFKSKTGVCVPPEAISMQTQAQSAKKQNLEVGSSYMVSPLFARTLC